MCILGCVTLHFPLSSSQSDLHLLVLREAGTARPLKSACLCQSLALLSLDGSGEKVRSKICIFRSSRNSKRDKDVCKNLDLGLYFVRLLFFGLFSAPFITLIQP